MIQKSAVGKLTDVETLALNGLDIALLNKYEQARNLTITLLKEWLAEFKFRNWTEHRSNPEKKGQTITNAEKDERAEEVANILPDNKKWPSHERRIGLKTLQTAPLRLEIEDYSKNRDLQAKDLQVKNSALC